MVYPSLQLEKKYDAYQADNISKIESQGFKILSGDIVFYPDSQSSVLLEFDGKKYDCMEYVESDPNANILFSCGTTKQSLDDIVSTSAKN